MSESPQSQQPVQAPQPVQPATTLTPEQQEFMQILNDLILSAQELSYALAVIDHEVVEKVPEVKELMDTAKSVVKTVWKFHKFVKNRMKVSTR